MSRIQHLCAILFAVALLAITFVNAATLDRSRGPSPEAQQFRELLKTVDAATLHDILHEHLKDKYQHGVWPEDNTALEALHKENAEVAQNLVQLAKRQSSGGSANGSVITTTQFTEITTEVTVISTNTPPLQSPTPTPESPADTPTPTPTPTPSPTPTPTPTPSSSSSITSSSTTPSTLSTTTSSRTSSSAPSTSSSLSSQSTEEITTEIIYTTTFADGGASVVTQVTVVPADQATQPTGSRTNTANASLQTGNGANDLQHGWTAGAGLVGMALMWAL